MSAHKGLTVLSADGTGLVYYPSGQVAVMTNRVDGGVYSYFYDDNSKHTLLANFNFAGIGFVFYSNGEARFITTKQGGMECTDTGRIKQEWLWEHKGRMGPPAPISFNLNSSMRFSCVSKTNITIKFSAIEKAFEVGKPQSRSDTYLDKVTGKDLDGRLKLTLNRPTLVKRQTSGGNQVRAELKKAQELGWALPRLSASGRETAFVEVRKGLEPIMTNSEELNASLRGFTTEIGRNVLAHSTLLAPHSRGSTGGNRLKLGTENWSSVKAAVPPAKVRRARPPPPLPPLIPPSQLPQLLTDAERGQLVVVCLTTRNSTECKRAEQLCTAAQAHWLRQHKMTLNKASAKVVSLRAAPPLPLPPVTPATTSPPSSAEKGERRQSKAVGKRKESAVRKESAAGSSQRKLSNRGAGSDGKRGSFDDGVSAEESERVGNESGDRRGVESSGIEELVEAPASDTEISASLPERVVLLDCRRAVTLPKRHNITVFPMYMIYYEGHLLFLSNTFNGFGSTQQDFMLQMEKSRADARRGDFLPDDYKLASVRPNRLPASMLNAS